MPHALLNPDQTNQSNTVRALLRQHRPKMIRFEYSHRFLIALCLIVAIAHASHAEMIDVIYETDMTFDVDDVGALAVLHALADRDEARILGVSYNEVHADGVAGIAAINVWYGRPDIPIGYFTGVLADADQSRYLPYLAQMRKNNESLNSQDSLAFYRTLLQSRPDQSVTVISVGFLNNLALLLRHETALVERKVATLIVMAGLVNDGFNFVRHDLLKDSEYVLENWPTPVVVTEFGGDLYTGATLESTPPENPVREAFYRWFNGAFDGRSSWDQVAVLVGVRGESWHFEYVNTGNGRLRNGYTWQLDGVNRIFARPTADPDLYRAEIEQLMTAPPRHRIKE